MWLFTSKYNYIHELCDYFYIYLMKKVYLLSVYFTNLACFSRSQLDISSIFNVLQ